MKARKVSQTPTFMISCGSFLGRVIENGLIKNFPVRDECFVLDAYDYLMYAQIAGNILKTRSLDLQVATEFN